MVNNAEEKFYRIILELTRRNGPIFRCSRGRNQSAIANVDSLAICDQPLESDLRIKTGAVGSVGTVAPLIKSESS